MVESQDDNDDPQNFGPVGDDDDGELKQFMKADYLDQCMVYRSTEIDQDQEETYLTNSALSSRPGSRYNYL